MAPRALPVSKLRARRRKRRLLIAIGIVLTLLVLLVGAILLLWLPILRIHSVEVVGLTSVRKEAVEERVRARLSGAHGLVLPNDNAFLDNNEAVKKDLLQTCTSFESVTISRSNLQTLLVTVVERTTAALWCGESVASSAPCFLLDASGTAYAPAANFSGEVYIKYYGPISSTTPRHFTTPEQFSAVVSLATALGAQTPEDAPVRVELKDTEADVTFSSGFVLMYTLVDEPADVLERFILARKSEPFAGRTLADFVYLDLRFGDKLYYRLK